MEIADNGTTAVGSKRSPEIVTQGVSKPMKWLPVAASFILVCAPSLRATAANKHHSHTHHGHNANNTKSHHAHHNAHHTSVRFDDSSRQVARSSGPQDESPSLIDVRYARQTSSSAAPSSAAHHHHHKKKARAHGVQLPKGPTPDRISEIQSALGRGGYYQGDPTGKWDDNTVAAMQKFQSANGIEASGKIDAPSLQKLGLGSDIAGVSAPRPPSSSVTTSTSPSSHSAVTASASSSGSVPLKPATETASTSNAAAPAAPAPGTAAVAPAPVAEPGSNAGSH
jgi:Putative peptidoglycan binding domain